MGREEVGTVRAQLESGKRRTGHRVEGSGLPRWCEGTAGIVYAGFPRHGLGGPEAASSECPLPERAEPRTSSLPCPPTA